jgi:hypothetical protein
MDYSKYTSPHPEKTKRERKKEKAEVTHSCVICEKYHPRTRDLHGYLLRKMRETNTYESAMRSYGTYARTSALQRLIQFEQGIEGSDERNKAFDARMATSRDSRKWWMCMW